MKRCTSCNREVTKNYTEFKCPGCGEETIIRCRACRASGNKYECSKCGFVGP